MLARTVAVLVLGFTSLSYGESLERALFGEWQSEVGSHHTFRKDHTFTSRGSGIAITGTWSVRGHRLVTINKSLDGREEYTNTCDIILRRDEFTHGMCEHVEKRNGQPPTRPELYSTSGVYHRVEHGHSI